MTRQEFLESLDEILELPAGTLKGPEALDSLDNWDSVTMISFIALVDTNNQMKLSARQIAGASTVADLLDLAKVEA